MLFSIRLKSHLLSEISSHGSPNLHLGHPSGEQNVTPGACESVVWAEQPAPTQNAPGVRKHHVCPSRERHVSDAAVLADLSERGTRRQTCERKTSKRGHFLLSCRSVKLFKLKCNLFFKARVLTIQELAWTEELKICLDS